MCVSFSLSVIAMEQSLEVCILFKKSTAISAEQVDSNTKERCEKFGMLKRSKPSDTFFPVVSAVSEDCLDNAGYVQFKKDLVNNIPYMIQKDLLTLDEHKQISILEKQYSFPTFVPQSFIDDVEQHQNTGQRIVHELYKNDKNSLTVCYVAKELKEKMYKEPSLALTKAGRCNGNYSIASFFNFSGISKLGFYTLLLLLLSK